MRKRRKNRENRKGGFGTWGEREMIINRILGEWRKLLESKGERSRENTEMRGRGVGEGREWES